LPHPQHNWPLQQVSLVAEERTVKGSYIGSCVPARDVPRYIGLYMAGKLPVDKLMGERMKLDDINAAFDRLDAGESMRDLVVF
jgi:alcohol dehydrogenase